MRIYYADIRQIDEASALYPPLSGSRGSSFGTSLLAAAYADYTGRALLPKIEKQILGRPVFTKTPEPSFSISHSKTHVFCALSENPVGIDTEPLDRNVKLSVIERLTTTEEREELSFLEIWTLRESFFKLTGQGDLKTLRFYKKKGKIIAPTADVFCHLYPDLDGSVVAVCSKKDHFPENPIQIPIESLLKKEKPIQCYPKDFRL